MAQRTAHQRRRGKRCPVTCPNCSEVLPPCVPAHVLEAAHALARLPGGAGTALDVVAAGVTQRRTRAAELLRQAAQVGLARSVGWAVTPSGQRAKRYAVVSVMVAAYGEVA